MGILCYLILMLMKDFLLNNLMRKLVIRIFKGLDVKKWMLTLKEWLSSLRSTGTIRMWKISWD